MTLDNQGSANDEVISRAEAAKILGVKPQTLAKWKTTKRYGLPVVEYGKRTKGYLRSDVLNFRNNHRAGG